LQNKPEITTTTTMTNIGTIALPKATALFYGVVTDNFGNPLPAVVDIEAHDNNTYEGEGYTESNGNYVAAAIGGLGGNDTWQVSIDNGSSFPNYVFSQPSFDNGGGGINLNTGTAVQVNFTAILATNQITGHVQDNFGVSMVGVQLNAYATNINGLSYSQNSVDTDTNGNYAFSVPNGIWIVDINNGGNNSLSTNYIAPPSENITISNNNGVLNFTVQTNLNVGGTLTVTTASLPSGSVGAAYSQELTADGDSPPYGWTNFSGSLPPGLNLDGGGFISGTPTTNGTFNFTVQASDTDSDTATKALTLFIQARPSISLIAKSTGSQFQFFFSGITNQNYTVLMSTNLVVGGWISLFTTNSATSTSFNVVDPAATNQQRFYRVLIGP
jgi:hypothetical protein